MGNNIPRQNFKIPWLTDSTTGQENSLAGQKNRSPQQADKVPRLANGIPRQKNRSARLADTIANHDNAALADGDDGEISLDEKP